MYPYVHCSSIYNSQAIEGNQVPINRQLDKKVVLHIYDGIFLSHKTNEILPFATAWMDFESIMLSEISHSEKNKYYMISLICRI